MEKWIDFARNVVGAQEKAAMQNHLESGCQRCSKVASLWQRVHHVTRHDHVFEPPESAIRSVKGTFAIRGPRKPYPKGLAAVQLLFDSSQAPLPAGVRSAASAARQLLFGASNYRIDIRIEPHVDSDKVTLIGQVLRTTDPSDGLAEIPIALIKGRQVVAETLTSQFGEFQLDCDLKGRFDLWLRLPSEELCLPLVEPIRKSIGSRTQKIDSKELSRMVKRRKNRTRNKV